MHPRNPYRKAPDFAQLAKDVPFFAEFVHVRADGTAGIDWLDDRANRALTKALLKRDFDVEWDLPERNLVPPLPMRLNYVLWCLDLMEQLGGFQHARAIDVGTGASCILALLIAHYVPEIQVIGTEVDTESLRHARAEIQAKNTKNIRLALVHNDRGRNAIFSCLEKRHFPVDFTVCNPPFFDSLEQTGLNRRRANPATHSELVCEGGEVAFVGNMIRESCEKEATWFTTMLGKKSSVKPLRRLARAQGATVVRDTVLTQGKQSRWALAWTFRADAPDLILSAERKAAVRRRLPRADRSLEPCAKRRRVQLSPNSGTTGTIGPTMAPAEPGASRSEPIGPQLPPHLQ
ncbi:MAG: hypothetical protein MHM6MM_004363 [Cercozoa sp. M6MM]